MQLRDLLARQRVVRDEDVEAAEEIELRARERGAVVERDGAAALGERRQRKRQRKNQGAAERLRRVTTSTISSARIFGMRRS